MNAKDFLFNKLNSITAYIPSIKIAYKYYIDKNQHLIKIEPKDIFENNERYLKLETELEEEFEKLFSGEEILFISTDSLTELHNPDHIFSSTNYKSKIRYKFIENKLLNYKKKNFECSSESNNYSLAA